jgi:hypothetical protein
MMCKPLACVAALVCVALICAGRPADAGGKKDEKAAPSGVWKQAGGNVVIEFADKDTLKISPHGDSEVIVIICKYGVAKGGTVKAKIAELDGKLKDKAREKLPVDMEFSFRWRVEGDVATLDNIKGEKAETLKAHVEGKYDRK